MDDTEARERSEIAEKAAIRALESLSDESMCIDELSGRGGTTSVAIIGAGSVGASIADQLLTGGVATEVLLADVNTEQCEGQVLDLSDCAYVTNSFIRMGSNKEAGQCDIVIITAGAKQRPGESRLDLIGRNTKIIESVCNSMRPFGKDTVLMLVANPVDVLTSIAQKVSGLPPYRVVGSGTYLDSMRLRGEIAKVLGVSSSSVHAYVLGEHGDSQVATWSSANVGGIGLLTFPEFQDPARREEIAEFAKNKAYAIIERKGATYYGVAACVRRLCEAILRNQKAVMPISVYNDDYGLYMSQPAVLGAQGVLKVLPLTFSDEELHQFEGSAAAMKAVLEPLGFWNGPFPKLS